MHPAVLAETGNAPKEAERLDRPGSLGGAHVFRFSAKQVENRRYLRLRRVVIAADEHGGSDAPEIRIDHMQVADAIERLDKMRIWRGALQAFHQGVVE